MTSIEIVPLQASHIPAMERIEKRCFGSQWNPTNFAKELENPRCYYWVAEAGQPIGYLGYWQILEEAHITSISVHPDYQKRRIAQRLMCRMLHDCLEKEIHWITLEVKESNISAQNLYHKFGFTVLGRRKNYYQVDQQDALIMWTENISSEAYQLMLQRLNQEASRADSYSLAP